MSTTPSDNRRSFMKKAATGGIALSVASMTPPALGSVLGANETIRIGHIGVGGRGGSLLDKFTENAERWNIKSVAVCDIYEFRKNRAKERTGARLYHDYHDLLACDDVDAVIIATPDHWHMPMIIDALEAGKHVYVEKPMTRTFKEAKKVYQAAIKTDLVLQVGTQYTSEAQWKEARKIIEAGDIGKLLWSQGGYCRNTPKGEWNYYTIRPDAGPDTVDWSRFLGSAEKHEWDSDRYFRWRKYWDYSGGVATDLMFHKLAPMLIALGPDFPISVSAQGGIFVQKDQRDVPDTFLVTATYASEQTVLLTSCMANNVCVPDTIRGNKGTIYLNGSGFRIVGEAVDPYQEEFKKRFGDMETTIETPPLTDTAHQENFIKALRGLEKANCDVELGYKTMATIALAVDAYRQDKTIHFDPKKQKVVRGSMRA